MKKIFAKVISFLIIFSLVCLELHPQLNGEGELEITSETVTAKAEGSFKLAYGGREDYEANSEILYKVNAVGAASLIQVVGLEAGKNYRVEWTSTDPSVASIVPQVNTLFCGLKVNSPGYTGLSAVVYEDVTNIYQGTINVSLHVPLEFEDIPTTFTKYGLISMVQGGGAEYTLQLFTEDSVECETHPEYSHFFRKLKNVDYTTSGAAILTASDYAVSPDDIVISNYAKDSLTFSSSNPSVAEVTDTGCVKAVGAGFARITVATKSKSTSGVSDSITYNVVVAPEVKEINSVVPNKGSVFSAEMQSSQIVLQTNAVHADNLEWAVFKPKSSGTGYGTDISKDKNVVWDISSVNSRLVLTGLQAGVYTLVGIPKKDGASGYTYDTPNQYGFDNGKIKKIELTLTVPLGYPDSPVVMNVYGDDLYDTFDIYDNSNLPRGCFTFVSSDPFVASVGPSDGVISAISEGETTIRISPNPSKIAEYFGTSGAAISAREITVRVINGCSLNTASETLYIASTYQLMLVSPQNYNGEITWVSSNEKVVTVDESGLVSAVGAGSATVTAKIKIGGVVKKARCKFKVIDSITNITLSAKRNQVVVGDSITVSAKIEPSTVVTELYWRSSDETIAKITDTTNLSATVEGVKYGTVVISAVNKNNVVVGTFILNVAEDPTGLTLSDTEVTVPITHGFYQLYATVTPVLPTGDSLIWTSSNPKIATVSPEGRVTLVKPGTVVITVNTKNGLLATCTFTITQAVTSIKLDTTSKTMYVGETFRITYSVKPINASNTELNWSSSDTSVATVDSEGLVTAKGTGKAIITAMTTDGSAIIANCSVTVKRTAKSLSADVKSLVLGVNDPYLLEVTLNPADSSDIISFESNNTKVATVSKKGKVVGKGVGSCIIMITTDTGLTSFVAVTVTQSVTGISVAPKKAAIGIGERIELTATITPKTASDQNVTWTSEDASIATVNARGEVTGVGGGTVVISCTSDESGHTDYAVITVEEPVTKITLNETSYKLGIGKSFALEATVEGNRATNKQLKWKTSKKSVCTVSSKGKITGVKEGYATITCYAADGSGAEATCEVHVITQMQELEVEPTFITLVQGESSTVNAKVSPSNTTYKPLWSSSDTSVAVVNSKGVVTGIKPGTAVITAKANDNSDLSESCYVNVIAPVYVTSVTFSQSEVIMIPGETASVPFSIVPSNTTESYTWSSDNPAVVTVNAKTGLISARSIGSATITIITTSGKKGSISVYVVGLSRTSLELAQYESNLINLEVDGRGASNLKIRWDTDNQNVAQVSNGKVTGKALGSTTIYAVVNGRYLACKVTVIKNTQKR